MELLGKKRYILSSTVDKHKFDSLKRIWESKEQRNDGSWSLFDNFNVVDEIPENTNSVACSPFELAHYEMIAQLKDIVFPDDLSENALDVLQTGPVLDYSCLPLLGDYNRNKQSLFPLNFQVVDKDGLNFNIKPKADFAVLHQNYFYRIVEESKKKTATKNDFFDSDLVKLAVMTRLNLDAMHRLTGDKTLTSPFLVFAGGAYSLYLMFKEPTASNNEPPKFCYKLINTYTSGSFREKTQLTYHLRNLLDIKLLGAFDDANLTLYRTLKMSVGNSWEENKVYSEETTTKINPNKRPRIDEDYESGQSVGSDGSDGGGEIASAILAKYDIPKLHRDCEPAIPNCSFGKNRIDGSRVVIKSSCKKKEVDYLTLLSQPLYRTDPRNVTIQPTEIVKEDGIYYIVFPLVKPLQDVYEQIPTLLSTTWSRLIQQLRDYCDFLHEHKICHGDIKPSNLAIDVSTLQLVVLDCDLMEKFPDGENAVVKEFRGTEDWTDPNYVANPGAGFNPFHLERYSMERTCMWMKFNA